MPIGDNEGAAPVASMSARMVPANEVVAKLFVDFISSHLLPVCRLKDAGIDMPAELSTKTTALPVPRNPAANQGMAFC